MFWRLISFVLHQVNTTKPGHERDGLHHQCQAILRNSTAGGAFLEFLKLPVGWRGRTRSPFLRVIAFALAAALNLAVFGVAGIFTSEVTKVPGNSTLIRGPFCGGWAVDYSTDSLQLNAFSTKILADTMEAAAYVRQCYGENTTSLSCEVYNRRSLNFATDQNATCPFQSGLCMHNNKSAFSMDTGLMDSHADLGMNARPQNRVKFRRAATCAPIHAKQWAQTLNVTGLGQVIQINAGPSYPNNYTFSYVMHAALDGYGYALR
jgi:hypothetical protein